MNTQKISKIKISDQSNAFLEAVAYLLATFTIAVLFGSVVKYTLPGWWFFTF